MNPAYSVIIFTATSGVGYGLLALLGFVGFNHGQASSQSFALTTIGAALLLITFGLLSSTLHLGHPERAWRALSQWRSSWLSREGIAAVATYPIAMAFGGVWSGFLDYPDFIKPLAVLVVLMSVITVVSTAMIYRSLTTIRQWNHKLVVPVYLAFALANGSTLLPSLAIFFDRFQIFQSILAIVALVATLLLKALYWRSIDSIPRTHTTGEATGLGADVRMWEVPHTNTNFIQKEMGFVVARKHAVKLRMITLAALSFAIVLMLCTVFNLVWLAPLAFAVVFSATMVERWLFFAEAEHVSGLYYGRSAM
jgi:sulfite dehydrogenase (quinone) subunit SoeC